MAADVLHNDNPVNRPDERLIADAYHYLFTSTLTQERLRENALNGTLCPQKFEFGDFGLAGRSLAWKTFLIPVPPLTAELSTRPIPPLNEVRKRRENYVATLRKFMQAPDGNYEDGFTLPGQSRPPTPTPSGEAFERNNPLSLDEQNPWKQWFLNMDTRKTIKQDVQRTFPDLEYFRDPQVQYDLTNILYIQAAANPDVSYRQGMHELLASIYLVVDSDSLDRWTSSVQENDILDICDRTWVAADAWALFEVMMQGMNTWYEWKEPAVIDRQDLEGGVNPYIAPIVTACNRIQNQHLSSVDPTLWRRMSELGVEPQLYGIRWLRLLFTREFNFKESMLLWDGIFAMDTTMTIVQWICVGMLVRIRNKLIPSDYSEQLTYLLHYPTAPNDGPLHISLLLQQAVRLSQEPNTSTGASIVLQNRNILGIPIEVPERPARPNSRKRGDARLAHASKQSVSEKRDARDTSSSAPGFPETIARNILERGESLGINRAFFSTVSEIRKNLPDIPTAFTRQPSFSTNLPFLQSSSRTGSSWDVSETNNTNEAEIREQQDFRSGMEAEMNALRSQQKTLAQAVSWAVDALVQDAESLSPRKKEALECLSYVREVLALGRPIGLDTARLTSHHTAAASSNLAQPLPTPEILQDTQVPVANTPTATSTKTPSTPTDVIVPNVMLSKRDAKPLQGLTRIPHSYSNTGVPRILPVVSPSSPSPLVPPSSDQPGSSSKAKNANATRNRLSQPPSSAPSTITSRSMFNYSTDDPAPSRSPVSAFVPVPTARSHGRAQSSAAASPSSTPGGLLSPLTQSQWPKSTSGDPKPLQSPSADPLGVLR